MVLVIGTVLVTLVGVQISAGMPGAELRSGARDVASGLRYVRSQAMAQGREQVFYLDVERGYYWYQGGEQRRALPESLSLGLVTAESEVLGEHVAGIRFFPDGSATGGEITLRIGERRIVVDVDWVTGRVGING